MGSSSLDDCYFYYYSSCTKGSDCPFRHCEAALGTETVCTLWREGICYRTNCKFRHMESRINRSSIPCYWENQPGGCRKPHCVFFHHKDRSKLNVLTETQGLILPVSSQPVSPGKTVDSSVDNKREPGESHSLSPPHPIQPVVVSLGEEESDAESTTSTPIKLISLGKKISSPSKSVGVPASNVTPCEMDFGIKTLEQIRMEKIHRESEYFYNSGETDMADESAGSAMLEAIDCESNGYYPQEYNAATNEFTSEDTEMEAYQNASLYPMETNDTQSCSKSQESAPGDLRQILKKKRHVPEKEKLTKESSTKRIISLKKSSGAFEELPEVVCVVKKRSRNEDDMGFRVKTLDEIRKEKEKRQGGKMTPSSFEEETQDEGNDIENLIINVSDQSKGPSVEKKMKLDVDKPITNSTRQVMRQPLENKLQPESYKRKLCRKPLELYKPVQKERDDVELSARLSEHHIIQITEDSTSDDEDAAKNITQETIPPKEEIQSIYSLKRACDSDVPVASKVRKTITLQRTPPQKSSTSGTDEEKPLRIVEENQKSDSALSFKRRNIRRKNFNDLSSNQPGVKSEDFNGQDQNSDLRKDLSLETSKLCVTSRQNGACMDSDGVQEKMDDNEISRETGKTSNIVSSPRVPLVCENEKGLLTPSTVDEFDTLFLGTESDICIEETGGNTVPKAEDLFLEFEKIIQS